MKNNSYLSEDIVELLNKEVFRNSKLLTAKTGSLIFSTSSNPGQVVLIERGEYRLIDKLKAFSKLTLFTSNKPSLFGLSQLINAPFEEEIRVIDKCQYRIVNVQELKTDQINLLLRVSRASINPFEISYIKTSLQKNGIYIDPSINSFNSLLEQLDIFGAQDNLKQQNFNRLVYIDLPVDGFNYCQFLPEKVVKTFFNPNKWPRLIQIKNNLSLVKDINKESFSKEEILSSKEPNIPFNELKNLPIANKVITEDYVSECAGFKVRRAQNRLEAYSASLAMIAEFFELPTRRDTISRAANLLDKDDKLWIKKLHSVLDNIGLSVREVRINLQNPCRVPTPSVWIDDKGLPSIICQSKSNELTLINPINGIQNFDSEKAQRKFKQTPILLHIALGLHTPKKRFNLKWLAPYILKYRMQLIEVFAASFLTQLFALATPLLFQQIIDRVISKGAFDALSPLVILMLAFVLLETIFSSLKTFQFVEVSNRIDIGVGSSIVARMLRLNARFFDRRPVGELSSRLGELDNIRRFLTGTALTAVLDALFSILYFAVMFFYSPVLTLIVILTVPLLFLIAIGITPITQRLIRKRAEAASKTQSLLVEILSGIQTIKLQNAELTARQQWEDRHLNSINQGFKAVLANTFSSNALQLINKVSSILIIGVGAWLVLRNELTIGGLIAFRIISGYVTQPMLRLASTWQSFQEMSLSLERVGDIVNQPLEVGENEEDNIIMPDIKGNINFDSISYTYNSQSAPVLSSVSFDITAGSFVGVIGQSGCGKSSLVKMIPRLYSPTSGRILIDQYDISKVDLYEYRKQIGFVPQDCMLFEGTVFSNIALGDPQAESKKVIEMAKIACAHEFIMKLPYGYSTPIGEKGSGLSGGQRQRISLARMFLERPSLVVLDEATSALDVDTERQVVNNIRNYFKDKTIVMITHRLSSLIEADNIYVMHNGRVDSSGTHEELLNMKGRYFALYQTQFGEAQ